VSRRSRPRLAPGRRERIGAAAAVAVGLAAIGLAASIWRPLAPATGAVATELDEFAPEVLATVAAYRSPLYAAGLLHLVLTVAVPLLVLFTVTGRAWVRRLAGRRTDAIWRGGLVAAGVAILTGLVTLPLDVWIGYVHAGRWGFRAAGPLLWARDRALTVLIGALAVAVAAVVLLWAVRRWPRSWHWRLVTIGTVLAALVVMAYPLLVAPLFGSQTPLAAGPVRDEVESVLASAGEAGLPIVVEDASTRTTKVNAYVSGLGPTREVVLYDTILALPPDQVAVVVAHELAHREHRDLPRGVLLTAAALLVSLLLLRGLWTSPTVAAQVGARGPHDPRMAAFAVAFAAAVMLVGQPLGSALSRRAEAAADHRAIELTGEADLLMRTARTFVVRDLSQPDPPRWAMLLWATHPSADQRIRSAVAAARAQDLPLPPLAEVRADERGLRHPAIGSVSTDRAD
jgi:STE24 endopeptidase